MRYGEIRHERTGVVGLEYGSSSVRTDSKATRMASYFARSNTPTADLARLKKGIEAKGASVSASLPISAHLGGRPAVTDAILQASDAVLLLPGLMNPSLPLHPCVPRAPLHPMS
ncbi:hypothetical protein [Nitratireductor luteus]|uniref:hypothetical protein n=1 Tax=Nitratireductor luteus TaxID=2976980 RepID=UPI00223EAC19|nr:hypothetical protein [Nitratireductor luteus]